MQPFHRYSHLLQLIQTPRPDIYIHQCVAARAAAFEALTEGKIKERKSGRLKEIEERYKIDQIRKEERARGNSWH
jgi:hypothetical protein